MKSTPEGSNGQRDAVAATGEAKPPGARSHTGPGSAKIPTVPDYDLLGRIGGGAYGEVWLARSQATGALRAAKIVWRHKFEDDRPFQREFEGIQKFERISREHPSQLALFHIGRNDAEEYFYYVMELADNLPEPKPEAQSSEQPDDSNCKITKPDPRPIAWEGYAAHTLRAELRQGRLEPARVLELGLALTEALHHLHSNGLVHRDVKPSNVIFVNGRPKLADIGLVTDASDQCSIVGTEGYLPPEGPGTPQADIFSLGKVLYEATTGLDRRSFPKLPEDLVDWPDHTAVAELNEIVLRACAKDAEGRYSSCQKMHDELALLEGGKSVRQAHRAQFRWRLARRLGLWVFIGAAVLSLVALASRSRQSTAAAYVEKPSTNELAKSLFELGKINFHMFTGTNLQRANELFKQAVAPGADPNFAAAHGYLAATYFWAAPPWNDHWILLAQAKTAAEQALDLDANQPEAHLALGWYCGMKEWNWVEAEKHDRKAVTVNPQSSFCHLCYAELLRVMGRMDDALREIDQARSLDANSRIINARMVNYLICARRFQEALEQMDRAVVLQAKTQEETLWDRVELYVVLGKIDKAIEVSSEAKIAERIPTEQIEHDRNWDKHVSHAEYVQNLLQTGLDWSKQNEPTNFYRHAGFYARLGDTNKALTLLETMLTNRDTELTFAVMTDWKLDPLRKEQRFHDILKKLHFE